jgi:hypothetical protein
MSYEFRVQCSVFRVQSSELRVANQINTVLKKTYVLKVFITFIYILHGIGIFVVLGKRDGRGEIDESLICG